MPKHQEVPASELAGYVSVGDWLDLHAGPFFQTQFNVGNFLENAVLFGNGSNRPTGILNTTPVLTDDDASPMRAADAIEYIATSADLANDIIELYFSLKPEYRRNASFVMSSATLAAVRKLRDSNGSGFLWQANLSGAVDAADGTLLGVRIGPMTLIRDDISVKGKVSFYTAQRLAGGSSITMRSRC